MTAMWTTDPESALRLKREPVVVMEWGPPFLDVVVYGQPVTQGSKDPILIRGKDGKVRPGMKESGGSGWKSWRRQVRDDAMSALPRGWEPADGPVRVDLVFCLPKPASAPVRRRTWPHRKPDVDKLTRAVFDSLKDAGAWVDDSRAVELHVWKDFPGEGRCRDLTVPGVHIRLWRVPEPTVPQPTAPEVPGSVPLPGM